MRMRCIPGSMTIAWILRNPVIIEMNVTESLCMLVEGIAFLELKMIHISVYYEELYKESILYLPTHEIRRAPLYDECFDPVRQIEPWRISGRVAASQRSSISRCQRWRRSSNLRNIMWERWYAFTAYCIVAVQLIFVSNLLSLIDKSHCIILPACCWPYQRW